MAATDPTRFIQLVALPFAPDFEKDTEPLTAAYGERSVLATSTFSHETSKDGLLLEQFKDELTSRGVDDKTLKAIITIIRIGDGIRLSFNRDGITGEAVLDERLVDDILAKLQKQLNDEDLEFWADQVFIDGFRTYMLNCHNIFLPRQEDETLDEWLTAPTNIKTPTAATDETKAMLSEAETGLTPEERAAAAQQVITPIEGGPELQSRSTSTMGTATHVTIPPPLVPPEYKKFLREQKAERDEAVQDLQAQVVGIVERSRLYETWFEVELQIAIDSDDLDRISELHYGLVMRTPEVGVREVDGVTDCEFSDRKRAGVILLLDRMLRDPGDPKYLDITPYKTPTP